MKRKSSDNVSSKVCKKTGQQKISSALRIGETVLAKYYDPFGYIPESAGKYYSGVVAEKCTVSNRQRYLIMFNDGDIQYTLPRDIDPTKQPINPWDDFEDTDKQSVKDIFMRGNFTYICDLPVGTTFTVTTNGIPVKARVELIDGLLFKVRYPSTEGRVFEWIYRGNVRIEQVMTHFEKLATSGDFHEMAEAAKEKPSYENHTCSSNCAPAYDINMFSNGWQFEKMSPLCVPFKLGWYSEKQTDVGSTPRPYTTPCGLKMELYADIHNYNIQTSSNIPMEFFSFDRFVRTDGIFEATSEPMMLVKDVSNGKEQVCVSFRNSMTTEDLSNFIYHSEQYCNRNINRVANEMCGCSCSDGCQASCECREKSFTGVNLMCGRVLFTFDDELLYECDESCGCSQNNCVNRLSQLGPMWPVEIYKTATSGFGVRTLVDIPRGSFVACFTGDPDQQDNIGNFTIFMNYAACPNLVVQRVWNAYTGVQLALFTNERVMAGEELTIPVFTNGLKVESDSCVCGVRVTRFELV